MLASPLGSAIGVSTALPLINALGGKQSDWILVMSILAIVGICCNVLAVVLIKERVVMIDPKEKKSNKGDVLSAIHNPYWWVSILITLVWNTFIVATSILTPYYSKYFLNDSLITTAINNAQTISLAICAFSCYWLTKRWEKSTILKFSMLITILGQILLITNPLSLTTIIVGTIIRCVGFGCMGALMFAMATDAIEYGHWYTGHRAESTTYSAVGIGNKMGVLMGSGLLTILLGMAGYDGSMQVQGDMAMNMIKMLYLWSPIALAVITVIIMMFYKLDEKYDAVLKDLNANKFSPNVQLQYRENARSY
jgi:GPH family glycoside/pentoside/hexuronide:cation symporter